MRIVRSNLKTEFCRGHVEFEVFSSFLVDMYRRGLEIGVPEETYKPTEEALSL